MSKAPSRSLLLALLLPLVACRQAGTGDIVIGMAGPLTEGYGELTRKGAELAIDEVNARGGIAGRKVQLLALDDSASGRRAMDVAESFVANASVVAVVGHVNSGPMLNAAKVYDGHLAAIATAASSPELTGISRWTFRVISNDSANAIAMAGYASRRGYKTAAVLYENDSYGRGLAALFRQHFTGTVVSSDPISADDRDLEPFISYYRMRKPDLVFVAGTEGSGREILREARRQALPADFMGGDGWVGITTDTAVAEGAIVGTPFTAADTRPEVKRFVGDFRARYHEEPEANAALGYDAAMTLVQAITAAGADREAVRDWLAGIGDARALAGVTGGIGFQQSGDRSGRGMVMTRVRRGSLVVEGGE